MSWRKLDVILGMHCTLSRPSSLLIMLGEPEGKVIKYERSERREGRKGRGKREREGDRRRRRASESISDKSSTAARAARVGGSSAATVPI